MAHESDLVPYQAATLHAERVLILAPHPDDEVIGCGGLLAHHLRDKRAVAVIVATNGAEAQNASDPVSYIAQREEESRQGLAALGGTAALDFLRLPDRHLENVDLAADLSRRLLDFRPDLIVVPSPIEIHPDHVALSRAFCSLIQSHATLFAHLAVARVAFYEVTQPIRPNMLVDITDVAERKYAAIAAHRSQTSIRDYGAYARGLNAYRAMTLPPEVKYAEAYYVLDLPRLRTLPFSRLQADTGNARTTVEVVRETVPITVVIRTRDRPHLVKEALQSVRATEYPAEIVVVNDGGVRLAVEQVTLVEHDAPRGRSEAMNSGVRAAKSAYIAFLDDDDLYYPEHLETLARATSIPHAAWYSDAVSAFLSISEDGSYQTKSRMRLLGGAFDRDTLVVDNFIPLPTLLVLRADFLDLGGFDPQFDLFEDWDFLIRLSGKGDFLHVPRITCEIRHFEGGTSAILKNPEGSAKFRSAKKQLWKKHSERLDADTIANAFQAQKQSWLGALDELTDLQGLRHHHETDLARLEREKQHLIAEVQSLHGTITAHALRVSELEGGAMAMSEAIRRLEEEVADAIDLRRQHAGMKRSVEETQTTVQALYAEIHRLQGILDIIYRSRTWKLHTVVERMRGRH